MTDEEFHELQQDTMAQCERYYNALSERMGKKGFIWLKDNGTQELMVYTRGEYTRKIMQFLDELDKGAW